uniref:Uncharacterized protein n=1 Tax=Sipha flava TaxID=143950 RepID=A0A2S2Q844_9HEMI
MLMRLKYHVKIHPWRSTSFPYQNTPKWLHRHYLMPTPRNHFQRPLSHLARVTKTFFFFFSSSCYIYVIPLRVSKRLCIIIICTTHHRTTASLLCARLHCNLFTRGGNLGPKRPSQ